MTIKTDKIIKTPNPYIFSIVLTIILLLLLTFTDIHFAILFMTLGSIITFSNVIFAYNYYGPIITKYIINHFPEKHSKTKLDYFIPPKLELIDPEKNYSEIMDKLPTKYRYALHQYQQLAKTWFFGPLLLIISLLIYSYIILPYKHH